MTIVGEACVARGWRSYYDPATAQFTTPDPLDALTGSRYGYAANDPINGMDPTGEICISWSCARSDIGAAAHTVNNDVVHPVVHATVTAGRAAWHHRDEIVSGLAIGTCIAFSAGACAVAAGAAFAVRAEMRVQENDFSGSLRANLADLALTAGTLGAGSAMERFAARGGVVRSGSDLRLIRSMLEFGDIGLLSGGMATGADPLNSLTAVPCQ